MHTDKILKIWSIKLTQTNNKTKRYPMMQRTPAIIWVTHPVSYVILDIDCCLQCGQKSVTGLLPSCKCWLMIIAENLTNICTEKTRRKKILALLGLLIHLWLVMHLWLWLLKHWLSCRKLRLLVIHIRIPSWVRKLRSANQWIFHFRSWWCLICEYFGVRRWKIVWTLKKWKLR